MRALLKMLKHFTREPIFLKVSEESRFFNLLKSLNLYYKFDMRYIESINELKTTDSCYIPIKIPQIESLGNAALIADPTLLQYRGHNQVRYLFDLSTEAITFSDYPSKILASFHKILLDHGINHKQVFLMCANANASKHYKKWAKANNFVNYQIHLIGYNFYFYEYFWEILDCEWLQQNPNILLKAALKTVEKHVIRPKHFLCLNLRPRSHRTAIVLHLLEKKFLEKGLVTYFGNRFADHDSVDTLDVRINFIKKLRSKNRLLPYVDELTSMEPICLDKDSDQIRKDLWDRDSGQVNFLIPEGSRLQTTGLDTYFEIVTETWFTDSSNLYLTEKTVRPIIRFQPFIHVGSPKLLASLRKMGFQTFSPYIDESYDNINDPYQRIELIFREINRLCAMSIHEIHQLYCKLWPRLLHNYHHFYQNMVEIAETDIRKNILSKLNRFTFNERLF